ncbi:hypothetical protein [Pedobacter nototheniae]|nr:hypothetical protein [Pedobacter nototheniae]
MKKLGGYLKAGKYKKIESNFVRGSVQFLYVIFNRLSFNFALSIPKI